MLCSEIDQQQIFYPSLPFFFTECARLQSTLSEGASLQGNFQEFLDQ